MILFARPLAVGTLATIMALDEAEVDYDLVWVEPGSELPELLARHPHGQLPFLAIADRGYADPLAIIRLIERLYPLAWEIPTPGPAAARAAWIAHFAIDEIAPSATEFFHGRRIGPAAGLPMETERMDRALRWLTDGQERLGGRSRFDILEEKISEGWAGALPVSRAGIAVAAALAPMILSDVELSPWPEIHRASNRLCARETMAAQLDEIRALLA